MNINTRNMNFVKFNNTIMNFVNYNGVEVYSAGYWLTKTGYPCILTNSLGKKLKDYKIYGNSEQDECGDNLLNIAITPTTKNGITCTKLDDGSYQFTGTSTASTTFTSSWISANRKLYKAGTYYIPDAITENIYLGLNFTTESNGGTLKQIQVYTSNNRKFTLDENLYLAQWFIACNKSNTNYDFNFFPQITKEDITEHKSYVSIPTPDNPSEIKSVGDLDSSTNKYKIPILMKTLNRCKSNRLNTTTVYNGVTQTIDANGVVTLNGTSTSNSFPSYASTKSFFLPKGTYTFNANMEGKGKTADGKEIAFSFYIQEDDSGKATTLVTSTNNTKTFTTTRDWNCKMYVYINAKNVTLENVKYSPMLVEGKYTSENMPAFEPYKNDIITNIYLDEPLRKVGNYADYIDFKNQKVVRQIGVKIFNGTETWSKRGLTTYDIYQTYDSKWNLGNANTPVVALSNNFIYNGKTDTLNYFYIMGHGYLSITFAKYGTTTANDIKNFMLEKYQSGSPVIVHYKLATPIEENITLPEIDTFKGTSVIETDTEVSPSNIEAIYKSSKVGDTSG